MRRLIFIFGVMLAGCGDNQTHPDPHGAYDAGAPAPLQCVPNLDGHVDATEAKPILNVQVSYLVSPAGVQRNVDLAGTVDGSGHRTWSFGTDFADDARITVTATDLGGKWYAGSFPGAQFTTPFDAGHSLEAIYAQTSDALLLYGLASTQPMPPEGQTLLVYQEPVIVLKFPLAVGSQWSSTGVVMNAMVRGLPYAGTDLYESTDDATGQLVLPSLTFTQVHRVRTKVTTTPAAGATQVTRQTSFFFECFGEVLRATSQPNETNDDFTTAAELRRFGP